MPLRLVKGSIGCCQTCGAPCQPCGSKPRPTLAELWRVALLTVSVAAWSGFSLAVGWLIGTGTQSGLHLAACLASAVFLLNVAYCFWRQITGRAASYPAPQKVVHIYRRLF
jgi:hypothetical protein